MLTNILLGLLPAFALLVITAQSPVYSVLALIVYTTLIAIMLFIHGFTFVGLLYVVVYVGAVAILFIFVLMIIDVREAEVTNVGNAYTKNIPLTMLITAIAFFTYSKFNQERSILPSPYEASEIHELAYAFYGYSTLHFLLVSLLLLTAIIGPITLCIKNPSLEKALESA